MFLRTLIQWLAVSRTIWFPKKLDVSWTHMEKALRTTFAKYGGSIEMQDHVLRKLKPLWETLAPTIYHVHDVTDFDQDAVNQISQQVGQQAYDKFCILFSRIAILEADLYVLQGGK